MAITAQAHGPGVLFIVNNAVNWVSDTINASLHTSAYVPNVDTDDFFNDATNELAAGGGYSAGGVALAGKTAAVDAATNQVRLDANDIVFPFSVSKTWRVMALRKVRGGAASADELIATYVWDSDQTKSTSHTLVVDATGLIRFTY